MKIYTLGHSTRSFEDFKDILKTYNIELVVDVRRSPKSKKFPHFNKKNLEEELPKTKIQYINITQLGGFRKEGYLAFSKTKEFTNAINQLLKAVNGKIVAIVCAEILWWRCHRRYIAKILNEKGYHVIHIFDKNKTQKHNPENKEVTNKMQLKLFCDKKKKTIIDHD
jgi:uncharacterized protein (DUF488 family)